MCGTKQQLFIIQLVINHINRVSYNQSMPVSRSKTLIIWCNIAHCLFCALSSNKESSGHSQRPIHQHSPTSSVTSVGSLSRAQSSTLSSILASSHSSAAMVHQVEPPFTIGPRSPQGPGSHQGEPYGQSLPHPSSHQRPHGFPHDPYGSAPRGLHLHQHQFHPQSQQQPGPGQHYPHPHSLQGDPYAMLARAQQMVDMLTEENRQLKQEMEVCGEKVSKLQKVSAPA